MDLKKKASQYLDFKHVKLTNEVFALVEFPLWLHLCFQFSLLWFGVQHGWNLCCVWLHKQAGEGRKYFLLSFPTQESSCFETMG